MRAGVAWNHSSLGADGFQVKCRSSPKVERTGTAAVYHSGGGKRRGGMAMCYDCMAFAAGSVSGQTVARKPVEVGEEPVEQASIGVRGNSRWHRKKQTVTGVFAPLARVRSAPAFLELLMPAWNPSAFKLLMSNTPHSIHYLRRSSSHPAISNPRPRKEAKTMVLMNREPSTL